MPPQQGVGRDDRRDRAQRLATHSVRPRRESPSVVVREAQPPPAQLPAEEAILLDQVREHLSLPLIQPGRDGDKQQLERRDVNHDPSL